jgi:hypothetical protein
MKTLKRNESIFCTSLATAKAKAKEYCNSIIVGKNERFTVTTNQVASELTNMGYNTFSK